MPNILVQAFIGFVIANLAVLAVVVLDRVPPREKQRRDRRCTCPCCRCGDSLD